MLKGYIKCEDIGKLILGYINFELSKNDMSKVAIHLRNCPICMEKYTRLLKRKKELKKKMSDIEKTLRMQMEISAYMDNEASEDTVFIIEGMLLTDEKYRQELIKYEEIRRLFTQSRKILKENIKAKEAIKIIAKIKNKKRARARMLKSLIQLFQPLRHAFLKSV